MGKTGDYVYRDFVIEDLDKHTKEAHRNINAMYALDYLCDTYNMSRTAMSLEDVDYTSLTIKIRFILHQIVNGVVTKSWYIVPVAKG